MSGCGKFLSVGGVRSRCPCSGVWLLGDIADSDSTYCDTCYRSVVCPSDKLMHPAEVVGRNEMPFDRDTRVVPSNIVLDRGPVPHGKGRCEGSEPLLANLKLVVNIGEP